MAYAKNDPDDNEILTNKTAAASGSTALADCTAITTTDATDLAIHVKLTFNASATLGARVKLFASYDDGTNYESYPFWQYDIAYTSGAQSASARVPFSQKRIKVQVTNLDTGQSITAIYVYYSIQTA
jgi:hypothetical protein